MKKQDKNNPEWTKKDFSSAKPAKEILPGLVGKSTAKKLLKKRGRPANPARKEQITVRLDPEIISFFKKNGAGYHSRINSALRDWINAR